MRTVSAIPPDVLRLQGEVSDPKVSAWVAANAGSGKTHVLAQRVINLLLDEVAPEKILCITFTKAAAANMAKRVFDTLAGWTTLDDAALDGAIRAQSGFEADPRRRALARRLFARALETPGGLKVHTIHAFCTQLLHQFPFEANVAARFAVVDETEQQLQEQITLHVLLDGAREPNGPLGRALATAMTFAADQTFRDVVRAAIGRRDAVMRWVRQAGGVGAAVAALSRALAVDPLESRENLEAAILGEAAFAADEWTAIAAILDGGNKSDIDQAARFRMLTTLPPSGRLDTYLDIFCTSDTRAARKSIVTRAINDGHLLGRLAAEQTRICALLERRRAVLCRDRSAALLTVVHEVISRYELEKQRRGLLDYDDLIDKTLSLLCDTDAAWVHYKLDFGIDHLLIDEAQDTSSKQWEIVRRLTDEFTAGAGARDIPRTIFAVGDEKQSIYSFQNAAPHEFSTMRSYFERRHSDTGTVKFRFREFKHSFRSGESVLGAVDEVFKRSDIAASVCTDSGGFPPHIALPDALPALVEIWEPAEPDERKDIEGWDAPFDDINETSPRVKLARRIARAVRKLVDDRVPTGADRRPARYGDVLILVRQRGELFEAIIRALKNEKVDVAGADRLVLTEHIAVMDLIALADALLLPDDDLALAAALRSPLFGFEDDDLFAVAYDRGADSLRQALLRKADGRAIFADAAATLDRLDRESRAKTPFTFFAGLLGAGGARRRFLSRLGPEANDALDEFLNLALDYERRETPSLQGFVAWLREARAEVKRDMEIARNEVRVMTVHGAKGLEAPIVILADTMTPPAGPKPPRLLPFDDGAMIWIGRKADDPPPVATARQNALAEATHEYRRLLYVAMTRAAERLIICGADGYNSRPAGCWYNLVRDALDPLLTAEDDNGDKVLRYRKPAAIPETPAPPSETKSSPRPAPPSWLRQTAPAIMLSAADLSPSSAFADEIIATAAPGLSAIARQKALARGRLCHRLLQSLPDIPPARRGEAAKRFLASAMDFSAAEQDDILRQVVAVLNAADFAPLFVPGSRAEVPIVGRLERAKDGPVFVSGQIDRLVVTDDMVLIADYKTDGVVPKQPQDAPEAYIAQLALYRAVLAKLYPDKRVRAALIFTAGPSLLALSGTMMDDSLARIMAQPAHAAAGMP